MQNLKGPPLQILKGGQNLKGVWAEGDPRSPGPGGLKGCHKIVDGGAADAGDASDSG